MRVVVIIQARMNSTRFPGKILKDLCGKSVLERVHERVKAAKLVNEVVIATTVNSEDDAVERLCKVLSIPLYRGSENDVLDRFYQAATLFNAENMVRITADCPLMDPLVIDEVVGEHLKQGADYTANTLKETYPDGQDVEVFTFSALAIAWDKAKLASEIEHVTPYIRKHSDVFKLCNIECKEDLSAKRWALDNSEDYEFIKKIYDKLYRSGEVFHMRDILKLLSIDKTLENINNHIQRNEGYTKSINNDFVIKPLER